jgi:hypothetical protein
MSDMPNDKILRGAIAITVTLNSLMAITGALSNSIRSLHFLRVISKAIAAPPSWAISWVIRPKQFTMAEFALAAIEGLVFSVVFYLAVGWVVLWGIVRLREAKGA